MEEKLLGSESKGVNDLKGRVWEESKKIWRVGFPSMLARVSQFGMFVVTQAFIGHVAEIELAGYALTQIIAVRFANGILLGMSSATETLCGQAFGAKQYDVMGIYLQRSWIVNLVAATLLLPVFIFSAQIFKLLGGDEEIANIAGYISLWFIPILYFFVFSFTTLKFLQSQMKNMIVGWISAASFVLHVFLSWIFVSKLNLGVPGAMSAMIISSWLSIIGQLLRVMVQCTFSPLGRIYGKGLDSNICLFDLPQYHSLGVYAVPWLPSFLQAVIEAVSDLSFLLAFSVLLNSFQSVLTGVAVGAGRQSIVAYINIGCYYVIGVPVGVILGYVFHMQVKGIWIGMTLGVVMQVSVLGYITFTTDWDEQVEQNIIYKYTIYHGKILGLLS
ncbi:PROTEIN DETOXIFICATION [Salix purpurea]|uniref:PROTEIN DETOXIFICATION n=1 Tax=Salix purpurea TaxID=77065 RepID=A0A9Q0ZRE3_SALPP|nr:PROTEIN DETOXIFICATION [Salix purpurea]